MRCVVLTLRRSASSFAHKSVINVTRSEPFRPACSCKIVHDLINRLQHDQDADENRPAQLSPTACFVGFGRNFDQPASV